VHAVLIGHSFVNSLDDHLQNTRLKQNLHPATLETDLVKELRVAENLSLVGQRGASLNNFQIPDFFLKQVNPGVIVLDLGTNDLAKGTPTETLILRLYQFACHLATSYVTKVVLLSIIPRASGFSNGMSKEAFDMAYKLVNSGLQDKCRGNELVLFWKQKGFYETEVQKRKFPRPIEDWSFDGIHPNRPEGRKLYKSSIRAALCLYLKSCR